MSDFRQMMENRKIVKQEKTETENIIFELKKEIGYLKEDNRYHRETISRLTEESKKVTLGQVADCIEIIVNKLNIGDVIKNIPSAELAVKLLKANADIEKLNHEHDMKVIEMQQKIDELDYECDYFCEKSEQLLQKLFQLDDELYEVTKVRKMKR